MVPGTTEKTDLEQAAEQLANLLHDCIMSHTGQRKFEVIRFSRLREQIMSASREEGAGLDDVYAATLIAFGSYHLADSISADPKWFACAVSGMLESLGWLNVLKRRNPWHAIQAIRDYAQDALGLVWGMEQDTYTHTFFAAEQALVSTYHYAKVLQAGWEVIRSLPRRNDCASFIGYLSDRGLDLRDVPLS